MFVFVTIDLMAFRNSNWTPKFAFVILGTTLGTSVPMGYMIGSINSPSTFIRAWCNETLLSNYDKHLSADAFLWLWSTIVTIFAVGGIIGSIISAHLANKFGRRFIFYMTGFLLVISSACFYFCRMYESVGLLFSGRFVGGFTYGLTVSNMPMYHSELASVKQRGSLGSITGAGMLFGLVIGQILTLESLLGTQELWHVALSVFIVPVVLSYVPFKLYPESPKWLYVVAGKREAAETELKRLRVRDISNALAEELVLLEVEANEKSDKDISYRKVFRDPKLLLPMVIVCALQVGQRFSGISAVYNYSVMVFLKAGFTQRQASWVNVFVGVISMITSSFSLYSMRRFNRRPLMIISSLGSCVCLLLFGVLLQYMELVYWFTWASIVCILAFIIFFEIGVGPIPWFIGSEIFEVAPRPVAMSMGSLMSNIGGIIVNSTFPMLQSHFGGFIFILYSFICLLLFCFTKKYLPETRGRHPTEVSKMLANGFKSKILNN